MRGDATPKHVRYAVLSMDVEDWFHVDYLHRDRCDRTYSMLDGLEVFLELLERRGIRATLFCTGEIAGSLTAVLRAAVRAGHELASHTETHTKPSMLSLPELDRELVTSKRRLEDIAGGSVDGFRAPCFSLDDERLERVREAGYLYDSSRIQFRANSRYGRLVLDGYDEVRPFVFQKDGFFEFELSTVPLLGTRFPVSGGAYLRHLPWPVMGHLVRRCLQTSPTYVLYVHPYELSRRSAPERLAGIGRVADHRFRGGLGTVERKLSRLMSLLEREAFTFTTFRALRTSLQQERAVPPSAVAGSMLRGGAAR